MKWDDTEINIAKSKQARGESYISPSTGKTVASAKPGPPCRCKNNVIPSLQMMKDGRYIQSFSGTRREGSAGRIFAWTDSYEESCQMPTAQV